MLGWEAMQTKPDQSWVYSKLETRSEREAQLQQRWDASLRLASKTGTRTWSPAECGRRCDTEAMLDGTDKATFYALRLLRDVVEQKRKPLILWSGAGVSKWCNYPLWREVAEEFHSEYGKYEAAYNKTRGQAFLQTKQYPELFDVCRDTNKTRYYRKLEATFRTKPRTPVYSHFLAVLQKISPIYILTTNIDENLEHSLSSCNAVQRSNLERVLELLDDNSSFVAKLHGYGTWGLMEHADRRDVPHNFCPPLCLRGETRKEAAFAARR